MKKIIYASLMFLTLTACGGGQQTGQADVHISVPAAFVGQDSIDRIILRVSGPDLPNYIQQVLRPPFTDSTAFDVTIPFGKARIFEVFAPFRGTDNRMLYGRQVYPVLEEDVASADVLNLPTFPLNFTNFAEDAIGGADVVNVASTQPDIQSFRIYRQPADADVICSGAVVMEVGFTQEFLPPTSLSPSALRTMIEFDTDDNPDTGSLETRIDLAKGSLNNAFTQGADFMVVSQNRIPVTVPTDVLVTPRLTATASVYDVSGETNLDIPTINPFSFYNRVINTLYVCIPSPSFEEVDSDGIGRVNVLTGIEAGVDSAVPFTGNDILYRSGYVRYDLNLDTSTLPGAE